MKEYIGLRDHVTEEGEILVSTCVVEVKDGARRYPLPMCLSIRSHSPTGFEWGYCGSGPAQLALALVADCCGPQYAIPRIYQKVKFMLVSRLPSPGWCITEEEVRKAVELAQISAS